MKARSGTGTLEAHLKSSCDDASQLPGHTVVFTSELENPTGTTAIIDSYRLGGIMMPVACDRATVANQR